MISKFLARITGVLELTIKEFELCQRARECCRMSSVGNGNGSEIESHKHVTFELSVRNVE